MIILDTNVISELMRGEHAERKVLAWLHSVPEQAVSTVITTRNISDFDGLGLRRIDP